MASERRRKQVARQVQETVATLLLHSMKDPRASFVTVTGVEMNHDLTLATIRYSVLNSKDKPRVKTLLDHALGFFRTEVARAVKLRSAPKLDFRYDDGSELTERIDKILDRVLPPKDSDEE
ncbi:MAG TPA: 30S ribosome-binding factor RbfA [Planctomycetota bacterium]|nr:30S ribosome-binding factor RbfA [Planctomycetota bacterium]MDP7246349.1 30S ribosome-binding factor RbfA [Planctomycetota bacterium]HJM40159.1 30S ribosome-binding factor RbfA [Planctomycetota bacterium]